MILETSYLPRRLEFLKLEAPQARKFLAAASSSSGNRHAEKLVLPQHGKSVARVWPWVWQGCGIVASVAGPGHRRQGVAQAK